MKDKDKEFFELMERLHDRTEQREKSMAASVYIGLAFVILLLGTLFYFAFLQ